MEMKLSNLTSLTNGASREYLDKKEQNPVSLVSANQKIKVFISSICGNEKYDYVRGELKKRIEKTGLAEVYAFEQTDASSLSADTDYLFHLEDCDVCIFLIDNADGVSDGVQSEVDFAKKNNKISLYYFCKEHSTEKTPLEQSIIASGSVKSKTVDTFEDLINHGIQGLIDDIIYIYHCYCGGRFILAGNEDAEEVEKDGISERDKIVKIDSYSYDYSDSNSEALMPKSVLKNLCRCKQYIFETVGFTYRSSTDHENKTEEIDEWGVKFLKVLFEGHSIKDFNVSMFMDALQDQQNDYYHCVVCKRWEAIQEYFLGNVDGCMKTLDEAYQLAQQSKQPSWIINDILIDIRNQQINLDTITNSFSEPWAQKILNDSDEDVNYPLLDRIYQSIQGKYIKGIFKEETKSPYSITIGYNYDDYGDLFASAFIVALCNGSLTHILMMFDKLKEFSFYLSYVHADWTFRKSLFKFAIYSGDKDEVKRICRTYSEISNKMNEKDANDIMKFCENHTIYHQQFISQLIAFGMVGYYLNDTDYKKNEDRIVAGIINWLEDENHVIVVGNYIFECLKGVSLRMSEDKLAKICMLFMENHYSRWYRDLFKFIAEYIDLKKMSDNMAADFVTCIINLLDIEKDRKYIDQEKTFLYVLRNQDRDHTEILDKKVKEVFPDFYKGSYKLEISENKQKDFPAFVKKYIDHIKERNTSQGENGRYVMYGIRDIATIRAILLDEQFACPSELMDELIATVADTLLISKESIDTKLDAISLLNCVALKFPDDYKRNLSTFNKIIEGEDTVIDATDTFINANIDKMSIVIGIGLLKTSMGLDAYNELLEGLAYIHNDEATTISVAVLIIEYLEVDQSVIFPEVIDVLMLQNVLQWLDSESCDVRYYATEILLYLLRNPKNQGIINQVIIHLIDEDGAEIKNLIIQKMYCISGVAETTKEYVNSKCKNDPNYVVRSTYH